MTCWYIFDPTTSEKVSATYTLSRSLVDRFISLTTASFSLRALSSTLI